MVISGQPGDSTMVATALQNAQIESRERHAMATRLAAQLREARLAGREAAALDDAAALLGVDASQVSALLQSDMKDLPAAKSSGTSKAVSSGEAAASIAQSIYM